MWEWALIAGIVVAGLIAWRVARASADPRRSQDGDAGTTFYATDGGSYSGSGSYEGGDVSGGGCDANDGSDSGGGCDGGGGDGGGGD